MRPWLKKRVSPSQLESGARLPGWPARPSIAARMILTPSGKRATSPCRWRAPVGLRERFGAHPRTQAPGRAARLGGPLWRVRYDTQRRLRQRLDPQRHRRVRRVVDPLLARIGRQRYPDARGSTIKADCGGSNGARVRLWKVELQSCPTRPACGAGLSHAMRLGSRRMSGSRI
jgi:hypothetical protein